MSILKKKERKRNKGNWKKTNNTNLVPEMRWYFPLEGLYVTRMLFNSHLKQVTAAWIGDKKSDILAPQLGNLGLGSLDNEVVQVW